MSSDVPARTPDVTILVSEVPAPVGSDWWVGLRFRTALVDLVISFPPDQSDQLADSLPEALHNASKKARQQSSGLTVAQTLEGIPRDH